MSRAPGHHSKLEDAGGAKSDDDDRSEDQGEQQCDREREIALEHQELNLDALLVLQDEDKDHHQGKKADDDGRPCATQPGAALPRQGSFRLFFGSWSRFVLGCLFDNHAFVSNNA